MVVREYGHRPEDEKSNSPVIDKEKTEAPTAAEVTRFHQNADTDVRAEAIHHTLGGGPHQAASGSHSHNGQDSALLLEGLVLSGSKSASPPTAFLSSVAQALVRLGIQDNST